MEDRHVVHRPGEWGAPSDEYGDASYLAVYDGHGGRDIVDFLEHGMTYHVARELRQNPRSTTTKASEAGGEDGNDTDAENSGNAGNNCNDEAVDLKTRIVRAFLMTDIHARQAGILTSGATVAMCLVKVSEELTEKGP